MRVCPRCGKRYSGNEVRCIEDGTPLAQLSEDPFVGYQLGKYVLKEKIGKGGFGLVYLAEHVDLQTPWAVKILRKQFISDEQLVKRFQREARVASQIESDHVVKIVDTGFDDYVGFYYIMEYLKGTSLSEVMRFYPTGMPLERLLPILEQICLALDAAHQMKIVHRDLKPSNIILLEKQGKRDFVKVLDFGIAKVLQENEGLTATGQIVGSPRFMSPEQAQGLHQEVDPRSDIYSLGVILFWMLTGHLPFESRQLARLLFMHIKTPPPKLNSIRSAPHFTPELEEVVASALAKDKNQRPQTATELYQKVFECCAPFVSSLSSGGDPLQVTSIESPPQISTTTTISDTPDNISISADLSSQVQVNSSSPSLPSHSFEMGDGDELDKTRVDASSSSESSFSGLPSGYDMQVGVQGERVGSYESMDSYNSASSPENLIRSNPSSSRDSLLSYRQGAFFQGESVQSEADRTIVTPSHLQRSDVESQSRGDSSELPDDATIPAAVSHHLGDNYNKSERKKISVFLTILVTILLLEVIFIVIKILK